MGAKLIDPKYGEQEFAAEVAALIESGRISVPEHPEAPAGPTLVDETDFFDDGSTLQMSQVDALEWELWAGVEQDEAEHLPAPCSGSTTNRAS